MALVGDISQMYHQLVLRTEDRPLHRFLCENMDLRKEPEVYEFLRFVFGGSIVLSVYSSLGKNMLKSAKRHTR